MKKEIFDIISMSWSKETCYPALQNQWNESNSSLGQCAITSLVVNDFCGGKIMRCMVNDISHYYNLINGCVIDLTVLQFEGIIPEYNKGEERNREYLLSNDDTKKRYRQLLINSKNNFLRYGITDYKLRNKLNNEYVSKIPGTFGGNKNLKIYGKLDCPSALRWIAKGYYIDNRVFFSDEETAIAAGYRPCGRCMKKQYELWKQ